ncbi:hypothetical protein HDU81_000733 [Chytriomyces hyalinus]|nr:hypothetical protein HDU81_000733 [Chytriomyces hyalinus]
MQVPPPKNHHRCSIFCHGRRIILNNKLLCDLSDEELATAAEPLLKRNEVKNPSSKTKLRDDISASVKHICEGNADVGRSGAVSIHIGQYPIALPARLDGGGLREHSEDDIGEDIEEDVREDAGEDAGEDHGVHAGEDAGENLPTYLLPFIEAEGIEYILLSDAIYYPAKNKARQSATARFCRNCTTDKPQSRDLPSVLKHVTQCLGISGSVGLYTSQSAVATLTNVASSVVLQGDPSSSTSCPVGTRPAPIYTKSRKKPGKTRNRACSSKKSNRKNNASQQQGAATHSEQHGQSSNPFVNNSPQQQHATTHLEQFGQSNPFFNNASQQQTNAAGDGSFAFFNGNATQMLIAANGQLNIAQSHSPINMFTNNLTTGGESTSLANQIPLQHHPHTILPASFADVQRSGCSPTSSLSSGYSFMSSAEYLPVPSDQNLLAARAVIPDDNVGSFQLPLSFLKQMSNNQAMTRTVGFPEAYSAGSGFVGNDQTIFQSQPLDVSFTHGHDTLPSYRPTDAVLHQFLGSSNENDQQLIAAIVQNTVNNSIMPISQPHNDHYNTSFPMFDLQHVGSQDGGYLSSTRLGTNGTQAGTQNTGLGHQLANPRGNRPCALMVSMPHECVADDVIPEFSSLSLSLDDDKKPDKATSDSKDLARPKNPNNTPLANIILYLKDGLNNQFFYSQDGYIVNKRTKKVLDIQGAEFVAGTPVIQCTRNGGANQKWTIDGPYIRSMYHPYFVLDVSGMSGLHIIWPYHGGHNQQFLVSPL